MPPRVERPIRIAYLVSHPIYYQVPLLRLIAAEPDIDLTVFFESDLSLRPVVDPGFGAAITWDVDLLGGYRHEFLPALGSVDELSFFRPWNYGLWRRLRQGRFDVLWVHGYAQFYNLKAMAMARLLGMRVLVRDEVTEISKPRGRVRRLLKRGFFFGLRHLCHGFTAIGTLNAAYYRRHGVADDRVFLMPYAVDNDFFRRGSAEARQRQPSLRAELGLEEGAPVILYLSKLQWFKHPDILLAAYARVAQQEGLNRPYLVFVGAGELRESLEAEAARLGLDHVRFLGFKGQRELPAFFDLADIFVLPSSREPWGLVVNEAMNGGTAVIVTDKVGCAPDLVKDGVNGLVVTSGDTDALAAALHRLLADRDATRRMGEAGLDIIQAWDYAADLQGLRRALGLSRTPPSPYPR